jgi:hypothetical protein
MLMLTSGYMKKVKETLKEKNADEATITSFEKKAQGYAKKIVAGFKDYDFYVGESMDPDGMYVGLLIRTGDANHLRIILLNYREDGVTPFVTIWKDGLSQMKV